MCRCCGDEPWVPRQFGCAAPPWAWVGPWRAEAGPWATGPGATGPWWRSRPRREDLEEAKRELEARLAEVNAELAGESSG